MKTRTENSIASISRIWLKSLTINNNNNKVYNNNKYSRAILRDPLWKIQVMLIIIVIIIIMCSLSNRIWIITIIINNNSSSNKNNYWLWTTTRVITAVLVYWGIISLSLPSFLRNILKKLIITTIIIIIIGVRTTIFLPICWAFLPVPGMAVWAGLQVALIFKVLRAGISILKDIYDIYKYIYNKLM